MRNIHRPVVVSDWIPNDDNMSLIETEWPERMARRHVV